MACSNSIGQKARFQRLHITDNGHGVMISCKPGNFEEAR